MQMVETTDVMAAAELSHRSERLTSGGKRARLSE